MGEVAGGGEGEDVPWRASKIEGLLTKGLWFHSCLFTTCTKEKPSPSPSSGIVSPSACTSHISPTIL